MYVLCFIVLSRQSRTRYSCDSIFERLGRDGLFFREVAEGDSLSPSSASENKKGRTRASSCFSLSINFLFFLSSFLFSVVVRPRSGTAVVVSQCVRKKCHVVLFFSSGKEGQILVYLEFILGSLSFSDAQVLCATAIFDLLSSVTLFLFLTFFCPFLFLFPLPLSCVFIYFLTVPLFSLFPPFLSSSFLFLSSYTHGLTSTSPELCVPRNVIVTATDTLRSAQGTYFNPVFFNLSSAAQRPEILVSHPSETFSPSTTRSSPRRISSE